MQMVEIEVCVCCALAIANGDVCDCPGDHASAVTRGMERECKDGWQIHVGRSDGGDDSPFFSHQSCDVCVSRLAGDRHPATLYTTAKIG